MPAHDLLAELAQCGIAAERHGGELRLKAPATPPADLMARIRQRKADLLAALPDSGARAVVRWRDPCWPAGTWTHALGAPGLTREQVADDVVRRWPDSEVAA